jgi:CheY-like chemotaxis protein
VTTPAKQHQILFVDDETVFLDTLRALFTSWSKNAWRIECAASADQALEILKTRTFHLVVLDVNMPVLDGVQFLRILGRRYPDLKKVVLTGFATEEKRAECLTHGAELFIEKPRSADGLKSIFAMLDELVSWKQQSGFQGMLRRVGLQDVIQMECLGRNSSILEVNDGEIHGRIYIEDGRIIHAIAGELTGEGAFQNLLSLAGGSFQLEHFEAPAERTIEGQWEFLLMEAARMRDENAAKIPEPAPEPKPEPVSETATQASGSIVRVAETLICSGHGKPFYQWQCADVNARVALLLEITQQASRVARLLPLGKFDRLELQLPAGRVVAQAKPDRMIFVHVATEPVPAASTPAA